MKTSLRHGSSRRCNVGSTILRPWGGALTPIDNLILIVGVLSVLVYFYFSKEHTGLFGKITRVGIWTLMITFGAGFGYTVMGRIALLVGRLEFIFVDWLKLASQ